MNDRAAAAPTELRRELGLADAVGIGFGAIVGAGIFVVIGIAAGIAGPAFLLGLFVAGIAATANALSSAQLAAAYPRSGGTYEYGYQVLTPAAGFAAGWMFLASKISAAGTVAIGLTAYLAEILPGVPPRAIGVGAIMLFTVLNYLGIRRSSRANLLIVAVSLGSLLLFILVGASSFRPANLRPFVPHGWRSVLQSAALLFFAYTGYARIATLGEEVRDPRRTIPRAVVLTIAGAILLYFAVAIVALGGAGASVMATTGAPLHAAAVVMGKPWLATTVAVGGLTAMLGVILSQVLGLSRMAFAMARRGDLPRVLDHVGVGSGVPDRAVLAVGVVAAIVAATGSLRAVAAAASFTILVYYGIANVAALRMPRGSKIYSNAVPIVGLIGCIALAASLPLRTIGTGVAVLVVGFVFRWLSRSANATGRVSG